MATDREAVGYSCYKREPAPLENHRCGHGAPARHRLPSQLSHRLRAPPWLPELRADAVPTVDTFIRPGVSPHGSAADRPSAGRLANPTRRFLETDPLGLRPDFDSAANHDRSCILRCHGLSCDETPTFSIESHGIVVAI